MRGNTRRSSVAYLAAVVAAAGALPGIAAPAHADVGRLFFTPQQRAELDKRRANPVVDQETAVPESAVTLNGYVRRSDGRPTTWVNGVPRYDTSAPQRDGRLTVQEPGGQVVLKPGQTADLVAGAVRDPLAGGQVRTLPSAARPQ